MNILMYVPILYLIIVICETVRVSSIGEYCVCALILCMYVTIYCIHALCMPLYTVHMPYVCHYILYTCPMYATVYCVCALIHCIVAAIHCMCSYTLHTLYTVLPLYTVLSSSLKLVTLLLVTLFLKNNSLTCTLKTLNFS